MTLPSFGFTRGMTFYPYTDMLDRKSYAVNRMQVTQEWTDANWIRHRPVVRERVTGTIHLGFTNANQYSTFLSRLAQNRDADGANRVSLLVLNSGRQETINAFLTVTTEGKWDKANQREWQDVTIKIEEQ